MLNSIWDDAIKSEKESAKMQRVRGEMHCGGFLLRPRLNEMGEEEGTEIIHVANFDLNGIFAVDFLARIAAIARIKGTVGYNRNKDSKRENSNEDGRGSSIFDIFSGMRMTISRSRYGDKKNMLEGDKNTKKMNKKTMKKKKMDSMMEASMSNDDVGRGIELTDIYGGGEDEGIEAPPRNPLNVRKVDKRAGGGGRRRSSREDERNPDGNASNENVVVNDDDDGDDDAPPPPSRMMSEWNKYFDEATQSDYYVHKATGKTQWDKP